MKTVIIFLGRAYVGRTADRLLRTRPWSDFPAESARSRVYAHLRFLIEYPTVVQYHAAYLRTCPPVTYVSHVVRDLQVFFERMIELGVQVQHLEQVVSVDFVQVAVRQRPHVTARLADGGVLARVFAEYVVLAWNKNGHHDGHIHHHRRPSKPCSILDPSLLPVDSLNIAITTLSFSISMEPRDMKYNEVSTSPWCTRVSPGGACVVRNFSDRALKRTHCRVGFCFTSRHRTLYPIYYYLKQPGDAPLKAEQFFNKFRLRCKQMSACKHSGNPLSTLFMSMPLVYVHACCVWKTII